MLVSLLTISIIGLAMGFVFSMPVAGPISILITSHSLKGEGRYCTRVALGAAIIDFFYCFIAVFGFTHLYILYEHIIPYVLIAGSLLIFYYGRKTIRTRLDLEHLDHAGPANPHMAKIEQKGGFRAGLMLNFLNPTLFIGWLTSSFIVISLLASLGFHVGNLNNILSSDMETINNHTLHNGEGYVIPPNGGSPPTTPGTRKSDPGAAGQSALSRLMHSLTYALFVGLGTIVWFYYFSRFLIRHRQKLNVNALNRIIQVLGVMLCCLGVYLIYIAVRMFLNSSAGPNLPV